MQYDELPLCVIYDALLHVLIPLVILFLVEALEVYSPVCVDVFSVLVEDMVEVVLPLLRYEAPLVFVSARVLHHCTDTSYTYPCSGSDM